MSRFPKDFVWGAATSSYQIEGAAKEDGRGASIWDTFSHTPASVLNNDNGDVANDHYHLYKDDIALMKNLGLQSYRFSFAWPRLFPNGDTAAEQRGFDFYDRMIDELLAQGIKPLGTVYHWDLPQALQDKGGWAGREILKPFEFYAGQIAEKFGDRVKSFSPINEPWVVSWLGYGIGIHAPGHKSRQEAFAAAHHTVVAHGLAVNAMRSVRSDLLLGPVLNQDNYPIDDKNNVELTRAGEILDAQQNRWWMDAFFKGEYPEILIKEFGDEILPLIKDGDMKTAQAKNDFMGINYYFNTRVGLPDPTKKNYFDISSIFGLDIDTVPRGELTDMGWPLNPEGLKNLLVRWHKELGDRCPPLFITENGCAYGEEPDENGRVKDDRRIEYLRTHIGAIADAISEGSPVAGYYQWSLMDNFEWSLGYEKRFGIVHVDYKTQRRTPKDSALWYREVIKSNGESLS